MHFYRHVIKCTYFFIMKCEERKVMLVNVVMYCNVGGKEMERWRWEWREATDVS